jgi:hypothetical protein
VFVFSLILLLSEGQAGEAWESTNKTALSAIGVHWTENFFHSHLPSSKDQLQQYLTANDQVWIFIPFYGAVWILATGLSLAAQLKAKYEQYRYLRHCGGSVRLLLQSKDNWMVSMSRPSVVTPSRDLETTSWAVLRRAWGTWREARVILSDLWVILSICELLSGSNGKHPLYSLLAIGQSVVYLRCVLRIHSYMNSVAITRTKVPFVEEGDACWEMNKTLILLHVSSTIS